MPYKGSGTGSPAYRAVYPPDFHPIFLWSQGKHMTGLGPWVGRQLWFVPFLTMAGSWLLSRVVMRQIGDRDSVIIRMYVGGEGGS